RPRARVLDRAGAVRPGDAGRRRDPDRGPGLRLRRALPQRAGRASHAAGGSRLRPRAGLPLDRPLAGARGPRVRTRRAVVVGAGLGGLATALRLRALGLEVTVVERGPAPGGRAGRIVERGYTWDTGPSLITMPWLLRELFALAWRDLDDELTLRPLDPFYRID